MAEPWRIVPDRTGDILRLALEQATPEEQEAARLWLEEHTARTAAQVSAQRERHQQLIQTHTDGILAQLLAEHSPTTENTPGYDYPSCLTCDEETVSWPCATWTTIEQNTPA